MQKIRQFASTSIAAVKTTSSALQHLHEGGFHRIIGLTGSIGTGKSHAREHLQTSLGAVCVDADTLAHSVYQPGTESYKEIVETFGKGNILDVEELPAHPVPDIEVFPLITQVFSDQRELEKLNKIVWPRMEDKVVEALLARLHCTADPSARIGVVEAAVLLEAGWATIVDEVWLTVCGRETQIQRVMERNHITYEDAKQRSDRQMSQDEKAKRADVLIDTSGPKDQTKAIITKHYKTMLKERVGQTTF